MMDGYLKGASLALAMATTACGDMPSTDISGVTGAGTSNGSSLFILASAATAASTSNAPISRATRQTMAAGATGCQAAERTLYTCTFGAKTVTVCAKTGAVAYRYGTAAKKELEIVATPDNGKGFVGFVSGGGGGQQNSIRFVNGAFDYLVYSAQPGQYMDATKGWSGVTVYKGDTVISEKRCKQSGKSQELSTYGIEPPLPNDDRDIGWQ